MKEVELHGIVLHPGIFHADECVGAATTLVFNGVKEITPLVFSRIERRNPTQEDLNNPNIWVIDHGKVWRLSDNNYDHHQDKGLPASNILVLDGVLRRGLITEVEYNLMCETLFNHVSMVDIQGEKTDNAGVPTLSRIIRGLNGLEGGFEMAMQVAMAAVLSCYNAAKAKLAAQAIWDGVEKFGHYALNNSPNFISGWQEMAEKEGIIYLITPNRESGKYQIISRNSEVFPIPAHESQTHNGGWMAVYPSLEQAIAHAQSLGSVWEEGFKPKRDSWAW